MTSTAMSGKYLRYVKESIQADEDCLEAKLDDDLAIQVDKHYKEFMRTNDSTKTTELQESPPERYPYCKDSKPVKHVVLTVGRIADRRRCEQKVWEISDTDIFHKIANHLDLPSLKIFMVLSKNIYFSLFYKNSSDNSWAIPLYANFYINNCIFEKGIERVIHQIMIHSGYKSLFEYIQHPQDTQDTTPDGNKRLIEKYKTLCKCCLCTPRIFGGSNGKIAWQHFDACVYSDCDCDYMCFEPELHCDCLYCKNHSQFQFVQNCIYNGCPYCASKFEFAPFPAYFELSEVVFDCWKFHCRCDGCHKMFTNVYEEDHGHCPNCDTSDTITYICEDCWLFGRYPERTTYFMFNGTDISMTPDALKKFSEFSLSEAIELAKQEFAINRWFRLATLLLEWTPYEKHVFFEGPIYPDSY